jgi:PAS domain S-box-containing protein
MNLLADDVTLSGRETEILLLALDGRTDKEIAAELHLTITTVRTYWDRLRAKLGAVNRAQAIAKALRATHQRTIDRMRRSEERFRLMADTVPDILFTAAGTGSIEYLNRQFYDLTGLRPSKDVFGDLERAMHPGDWGRFLPRWRAAQESSTDFSEDIRLKDRAGRYRWHQLRARRAADPSEFGEWFGCCSDVEDQKHAQAILTNARSELERLVEYRTMELHRTTREIEEFAYSISHDLRAPLRSIISAGRVLLDEHGDRLDASAKELILRAGKSANRLSALIDDLLEFSRLGRRELSPQEVDLVPICRQEIELSAYRNPNVEPTVKLPETLLVVADPILIKAALHHLLDNALKFSSKREQTVIEIGRRDDGAIFVRDNGVGFDERYKSRLFLPFERLHSEKEFPGNGIGLACVRRIVERHGGEVRASSADGEGAEFSFYLAPQPT